MFDDRDGCSKQYQSQMAQLDVVTHGVIIDWDVGAPVHGKDEVDNLNVIDKNS
jgi:hypothetical protein